jgi:formamidopyrimidine-DNA glycosylase
VQVLYKSFIYPWAKVGDLDEDDWIRLYDAIVDIISESYEAQSPKFKGSHFDYEFKVYGRAICPRGHVVKKEVGPHKRSVHWVQAVQVRCKPDTNLE